MSRSNEAEWGGKRKSVNRLGFDFGFEIYSGQFSTFRFRARPSAMRSDLMVGFRSVSSVILLLAGDWGVYVCISDLCYHLQALSNQQTVDFPSFKLVLVGDGGTGEISCSLSPFIYFPLCLLIY